MNIVPIPREPAALQKYRITVDGFLIDTVELPPRAIGLQEKPSKH